MAIIPRGAGGSGGGSSVALSTATPQPLGTAAAGSTGEASDAGHVHDRELPDPTGAPDGQVPTTTGGAYGLAAGMTNPMTTLGDLITGGASGTPGRLAVGAEGEVLTVTGGEPAWADAGGAYTDTTLSTASATGWTTRDGDGTAAITAGVARLTLGLGVVPGPWSDVPAAAQAHGRDAHNVDVRVRVAAITGGNSSNVFMAFGLRRGAAGNDGIFWNLRGDGGDSTVYREGLSGSGSLASASINRAAIAAGTLWLRLAIRGGMLLAAHGTGVGTAEPTDWTVVYSTAAIMSPASYISQVVCSLDAVAGGSPDAVTVDFAGFRVQGGAP